MRRRYLIALIFLSIFTATAYAGLYIGQRILHFKDTNSEKSTKRWHQILHENLEITEVQDLKLSPIEEKFISKRKALERQIGLANKELAEAIKKDKSLSLNVEKATSKIHQVMGELQRVTLEHLFEMRPILTDEQNRKLEQMITDALEAQ